MRAIMTTLSARRAIVWVLFLLALVCGAGASVAAAGGGSFTAQYPVSGSPYQVAVEAPDRVWATLPAQNTIVRLTLTSPDAYDVALFVLPVANSEPYDIAFAAGRVWFTERIGNRIGSLDPASDPATPAWTEYPVPTTDSEPTGITVLVGDPTEVWFAERAGNKLGRLRVSSAGSATMDEYELPVANAYPESVSALASEPIWFSAPGVSSIYRFRVSLWPWSSDAFAPVPTGSGSLPWDIKVNLDGRPWLTEPAGNRIGKYIAGTLAYFAWRVLPVPGSEPYSMDIAQGAIWFTEKNGNRVGQLMETTGTVREYALPGAAPTGIAADKMGCAWVAASGQNALVNWCPPHYYLPLVMKG
jgi:streptogramin lyase